MAMKARTQEAFPKKWVGVVEIKTGDNAAKLTSVDTNKEGKLKLFADGSTSCRISLSDFSKASLRVIKPGMKEPKKFRVRLNEDGDEVETVTPVNGVFRGKMIGIGPKKKDGSYSLIEKTYNKGSSDENSHLEFLALYEITDGVFRGVELPGFYLHYKFEAIPEGEDEEGFTRFDTVDTPNASQLHKLQLWAEVQGNILDEPIMWPDDGIILETLEERALEADRDVDIIFENGYIKSVQPVENYEEVEVEETVDEDDVEVEKAFPKGNEKTIKSKSSKSEDDEVKPLKINSKVPPAKKPVKKPVAVADADDDL